MAASIPPASPCVMDRMQNFKFGLMGLGVFALLTGCASDPDRQGPCPIVGILKEAEAVTAFAPGAGQGAGAVMHRVELRNVAVECTYRNKGEDNERVVSELTFDIAAQGGPQLRQSQIDVPYFVAVTRDGRSVLARTEYTSRLEGVGAQPIAESERIRAVTIPIAEGLTGASYEVIVGLVLTPEQVAYNRAQAR